MGDAEPSVNAMMLPKGTAASCCSTIATAAASCAEVRRPALPNPRGGGGLMRDVQAVVAASEILEAACAVVRKSAGQPDEW